MQHKQPLVEPTKECTLALVHLTKWRHKDRLLTSFGEANKVETHPDEVLTGAGEANKASPAELSPQLSILVINVACHLDVWQAASSPISNFGATSWCAICATMTMCNYAQELTTICLLGTRTDWSIMPHNHTDLSVFKEKMHHTIWNQL